MLAHLNSEIRQSLLRSAREAIRTQLSGDDLVLPVLHEAPDAIGVFVTVHVAGALRGCIGFLEMQGGLLDTIAEAARRAAASDPRFFPVEESELDECTIEVTLLGPTERINDAEDFEIGRHGLTIDFQGHRGLLLPQVPVERGWSKTEFLTALCQKARVADHSWERPEARLSRFEGLVIREIER